MQKHISFKAELGAMLKYLGPFMFLAAIMLAALFSEGSWRIFFDKTLPVYMLWMGGVWVVVALYVASYRKRTGVYPSAGSDSGAEDVVINPTTGSPMIGSSGIDAGGNLWGHTRDD
jgi:hypothetical protein